VALGVEGTKRLGSICVNTYNHEVGNFKNAWSYNSTQTESFGALVKLLLLLDALAKLRKATISFVMSVCLSVRMEQLGSHSTDFHEI
jgi:hypothetical protein